MERHRLMHVEDDLLWRKALEMQLSDSCQITSCSSIDEALIILKSGKRFDLAVVDLTIDKPGEAWDITTPEQLVEYLRSLGIGVAVLSGVPALMIPLLESRLGVQILDKARFNDFEEVLQAAIQGIQPLDE